MSEDQKDFGRELVDHKVVNDADALVIKVCDMPGQGGANHVYIVKDSFGSFISELEFQNGPIKEYGVNGLTNEALLAIVADRLRSFQKGPYACKANACALTHVEESIMWLQQRTIDRMRRGVEGTNQQ